MKRDRGSEKGPPTHTHPRRSELPPATWRPRMLKKNFFLRPPGGRGKIINRVCMGWIAQKKIKIKKKKRKEGLKEEDRREQAGERLIFFIQRTENS